MPGNRRSFVRELLALMPVLETEFAGQVLMRPFEEMNANELLIEVTPSKGYYAQASFAFRICGSPNYQFQSPTVSCLSRVFHSNIHAVMLDDNVCLNLFNNWSARYGLKDILYAILFLFYEPNFDDPWNPNASHSENGLTIEQTIWKSLHGGVVNSILYEPNRAWLHWADENGIELFGPCSTKGCSGHSTTGKYFRQALSGQYSPMVLFSEFRQNYHSGDDYEAEYAYIRHITVRPTKLVVDSVDVVNSFRRYYYLEQCINDQREIFDDLDTRSMTMSTIECRQLGFAGNQTSVLGNWHLRTNNASTDDNEPFYDQPLNEQPEFQVNT
ncbi:hypothetical protein FGIG_05154 [Fasciola gigantica]|uniref:UBC core domain-containing protein n=1 Tax=Fasciola gigantica TaxID=46835 RepID=A0A504YQY4_FASGI|nr:hypothetical protein FGIG_05154 [Fasciola gigantica]